MIIYIFLFCAYTYAWKDSLISHTEYDTLTVYQIIRSENERYYLTLQDDNNVVGYDDHDKKAFFATNTSCNDLEQRRVWGLTCGRRIYFVMEPDGDLVVYTRSDVPIWATSTNGKGTKPYKLTLRNDRNIVLTDSRNSILWESNTAIQQ